MDVVSSFHSTSPHAFNNRSNTACPTGDACALYVQKQSSI
jgi:hypothetical protein